MKQALLAALLFAPLAVAAQQPPSPQTQALQQTVIKLTGEALDWQARAIALQAENADLKAKLDAAKATPSTGDAGK